jgi:hypothetical protein
MSAAANRLLECNEYVKRLESMGAQNDDAKGPHHWSRKDSYEDAVFWLRYDAAKIIGKGC